MKILGILAVLLPGLFLVYAVEDFPAWGDPHSPASDSRVSEHYIEDTFEETQVPNMVTAVLADYRGYDTMFETVVIFAAGIAIIGILQRTSSREKLTPVPADLSISDQDPIVRITCRVLIPIIQLFGLYVVAHGHHSPGGGFQGGVIFGASFILMAIARNLPFANSRLSNQTSNGIANLGVLIYAGVGLLCLLLGANFLDYSSLSEFLPLSPTKARYHSMLIVEIGVAFTVAAIMFVMYAQLSTGGRLKGGL